MIFSSYCTHANLRDKRAKTIVMTIPPELIGAASGRMSGKIFREVLVTDPAVCSEILACMKRLIRHNADGMLDTCIAKGLSLIHIYYSDNPKTAEKIKTRPETLFKL